MSPKSNISASTVKTVDDVMSQLEVSLSRDASLIETRKFIRNITNGNSILTSQSIEELESIESLLSPISANVDALVSAMLRCNAVVAGPQATSFFYPICELTDCPWDIFCPKDTAEEFLRVYKSSSSAEQIEDVGANTKFRVVHFRKTMNGAKRPCSVRIFISNTHPMESVLSLKNSYEQTAITAVGAICFWPKLQSNKMFREFETNPGTMEYPIGSTVHTIYVSPGKKTTLKRPMSIPSIYHGISSRVEILVFKKTSNISQALYSSRIKDFENIVYCIFNSSSRYLGTTSNMK